MTTPDGAQLPPDILAVIDHLVERASAYRSIVTGEPRLQIREIQAFKSELMERTSRWHHDRVTPAAFSAECIAKGLRPENAATLAGHLRSRQAGKAFRPRRERKGSNYDGVIRAEGLPVDLHENLDTGDPSEEW
ncbi:hypothetical protein ACTXG5_25470 [Mycobacterium sp. Dal123C01]|uniref:hypothetical protein n=1 Tax=Mycobacterium sp. Dal123C01 TaxID=3457577 RepID=UPI00403ECEAE